MIARFYNHKVMPPKKAAVAPKPASAKEAPKAAPVVVAAPVIVTKETKDTGKSKKETKEEIKKEVMKEIEKEVEVEDPNKPSKLKKAGACLILLVKIFIILVGIIFLLIAVMGYIQTFTGVGLDSFLAHNNYNGIISRVLTNFWYL